MKNFGYVMATKMLVDGKRKVRFMFREERSEQDSGWCFFCGDETQDYVDNPDNIVICDIQTILDIDKSISPYLDSVDGSAFFRTDDDSIFQRTQDIRFKITSKGGNRLNALIEKIKAIVATDEYAMEFSPGTTEKAIADFESINKISFPKLVKNWLKYTDGCCLFNSTVQLYGVAHTPLVDVNPKGVTSGFVEIGAFNYGDSICFVSGQEAIFLCGETVIEYKNFEEFLEYVIEIGAGGH